VVVLALALQFTAPHLSRGLVQNLTAHTKYPRNSILYNNNNQPPVCPRPEPHVEFAQTFYTHTTKSMALAEQAKRVAAEFDFDQDHVRKAVSEFIREMGTSATVQDAPPRGRC
jgi:hexokinase